MLFNEISNLSEILLLILETDERGVALLFIAYKFIADWRY